MTDTDPLSDAARKSWMVKPVFTLAELVRMEQIAAEGIELDEEETHAPPNSLR